MDALIIGFSGFFILLGIAGSFLPIIPGPLTSWFGLFLLRFSSIVKIENRFFNPLFLHCVIHISVG